jgi:peptidoglycan hydrolase-like protein with peptidoglycan-binding domain
MSAKDRGMDLPFTPGSGPGSDKTTRTGAGDGHPADTAATLAQPPLGEGAPRSRSHLRRALVGRGGRRLAVVVVLLVVVAAVAVAVLGTRSSSSNPASGVPITAVATINRRDLVETDTESGTISHANPQTVFNRLSGTITSLPSVGQLIKPGQPLYELDGKPVILMNGTTPAYRELGSGDSAGHDILQLNRNLVRLGFNPDGIVIDDVWQPATSAGVEALQASLGEPETGSVSLGQVVFLPGNRIVSAVDASLGSAGGGGGPSSAGDSSSARSAGGGPSATPILQTTRAQLIVTVDLDASRQSEAKIGETVTVEMPAGTIVDGVITGVSPVAASSPSSASGPSAAPGSSSSAQATVPVTITLKRHIGGAGLDQAPVSVNFAQAVATGVLSVPVTALLATPGGGYAVQEAQAPHQLIPVTTGLFAAGYVQISGPGIYDGLQVTNSQG